MNAGKNGKNLWHLKNTYQKIYKYQKVCADSICVNSGTKIASNNFHLSRNICSCVLLFAELLDESLQLCYRKNSVEAVALGTFVNFQNIHLTEHL